jgi:hypothetical protein
VKRAALVLLAACGGAKEAAPPPPPPAVLADPAGPVADRRRCVGGPLDVTPECKLDGTADLDADGTADCWRASADAAGTWHLQLWIWPGCAGAPATLRLPTAAQMRIELPAELRTAAWAQGIAGLLVGAEHVGPSPALAWGSEGKARYTPVWLDGAPALSPPEAMVRDDLSIVVRDPSFDTPGIDQQLDLAATCDAWEVWTSRHEAAVVDRATKKWSRVFEPAGDRLAEAACTDDLVLLPHGGGADGLALIAINPRTGLWTEYDLDATDWKPMVDEGVLRTGAGMRSLRQIAALLTSRDDAEPGPCGDGPLLTLPPGASCTRDGKDDVDRDRVPDCWTATRSGNAEAGTLSWDLSIDLGCKGSPESLRVQTNDVVSMLTWDSRKLPGRVARWIATLHVGADRFGCLPIRKKMLAVCPVPGPAAVWLHDRVKHFGGRDLGSGLTPPVWQAGTPVLPPPSATLVSYIRMFDEDPALLLHHPTAEPVRGAPLAPSGSCPMFEVWTGPAGAAVVDQKTKLWTWVYLASAPMLTPTGRRTWPTPVGRGWCDGELAYVDLPAAGQVVVTRPATGGWRIVDRAAAPGGIGSPP